MPSLLKFDDIKNRIDWAARKARTACAIGRTPVDLEALCDQVGIHVEWRKMVPEGVTSVSPNRVSIYLQSNFRDDPRFRRRLRFTFAHEICHALFHEGFPDNPRPLASIPKGAALEKLCQQGAGYLLCPTELLPITVTLSSAKDFGQLANDFDVSMDVLVRRVFCPKTSRCCCSATAIRGYPSMPPRFVRCPTVDSERQKSGKTFRNGRSR
jgi:IrrE N-terminal-like domain